MKMIDALFLEVPQGYPTKWLSHVFRQEENRRKRLYFHRTVEMKQTAYYDRAKLFNHFQVTKINLYNFNKL